MDIGPALSQHCHNAPWSRPYPVCMTITSCIIDAALTSSLSCDNDGLSDSHSDNDGFNDTYRLGLIKIIKD